MRLLFIFAGTFFMSSIFGQVHLDKTTMPDPNKKIQIAELACGQCKFNLPGKSCDLAVRINGKLYFVDGTEIDSHGDAHDKEGFCNAIRKAEVQGDIVGDRYKITWLKFIESKTKKGSE